MPRIEFTDQDLQAVLHLGPGERLAPADARRLIATHAVTVGLDEAAIEALEGREGPAAIVVAQGTPPVPAQDARIEYLFRAGPQDLRPVIREDGTADFRNLGLVTNVAAGQVLARKQPPLAGQDGLGVRGHLIKARPPIDRQLRAGEGASLTPDGLAVVALKPGNPHKQGTVVLVRQEYQVPGSVSLATGNVHFDGDLVIAGNIELQMEVRATGDVTVGGAVEGARIFAGGAITVKGGVRSQSLLQAGGDVLAKYVENSQLHSGGSLGVQEDLIHSRAEAGAAIVVGGAIIGGEARAGERVEARSFGARLGTPTQITAMAPVQASDELKAIQAQRQAIQEKLAIITPRVREAQEALRHPQRGAIDVEVFRKVLELSAQLNEQDAGLAAREQALGEVAPRVKPKIEVREGIQPGVRLQIGEALLKTDQVYPPGTFIEELGAIRLVPRFGGAPSNV